MAPGPKKKKIVTYVDNTKKKNERIVLGIIEVNKKAFKDYNNNFFSVKVYTTTFDMYNEEYGSVEVVIDSDDGTEYSFRVCLADYSEKWLDKFCDVFAYFPAYREQFIYKDEDCLNEHELVSVSLNEKNILVDFKLVDAIIAMNKIGIVTEYSCQGGGDEESIAYIANSSSNFPENLVKAWNNAGFFADKKIVHAYAPHGLEKEAAELFILSLNDWLANQLDVSGEKYKVKKKRPNSLPKFPVFKNQHVSR